ncbi:sphingomyelin phosphodiesterase [Amycolatopsis nigrescens]|uniref:sphingomyelin phosphodiesterase n=1 Tax=Amycolatopsis nigrescens TaxID=381445 RepID=UPI00037C8F6E|nr:sphingomyelin phosphodiesterase [Amycolatopsis nigrescens]
MRKTIRYAALVLGVALGLGMVAPAEGAGATTLSVMSFNVYQLPWIAAPGTADKTARAAAAERTIRAQDPDVLVLNEAFSAQAEQLRARLADRWPHQTPLVGQRCAASGGWTTVNGNCSNSPVVVNGGVTVLSRYPITEQHQLVFTDSYFGTSDYFSNKGAALARIVVDGRPVWVAGTHLQADEGPKTLPKAHQVRMAQLGEIRDLVAKYAPVVEPVLIGGDLNIERWAGEDRRDELGRSQLRQGEAIVDGSLGTAPAGEYTFDATTNPLAAKSVEEGYRDSLDYLGTLRGNGRPPAEVGPVRLVHHDDDTIPSDHYPVVTLIKY